MNRHHSTAQRQSLTGIALLFGAFVGCKKNEAATGTAANTGAGTPAVAATPISWMATATSLRAQIGSTFAVLCPPGGQPHSIWGTDSYTSGSSICTAAVHSGLMQLATGGTVQVQIIPGLAAFAGTIRGGMTSRNSLSAAMGFSFVGGPAAGLVGIPVPVAAPVVALNGNGVNIGGLQINVGTPQGAPSGTTWRTPGLFFRSQVGAAVPVVCPPNGTLGPLFGTGTYCDLSSVCTAAVHAGKIQLATGGTVTIHPIAGPPSYTGSVANGVTSRNFSHSVGAFTIDP